MPQDDNHETAPKSDVCNGVPESKEENRAEYGADRCEKDRRRTKSVARLGGCGSSCRRRLNLFRGH